MRHGPADALSSAAALPGEAHISEELQQCCVPLLSSPPFAQVRYYSKPAVLAGCIRISVGRPEDTDAVEKALRKILKA